MTYELYNHNELYCIARDGWLYRYWFELNIGSDLFHSRWEKCSIKVSIKRISRFRTTVVYKCRTKKEMEEYIQDLVLIEELKK